MSKIGEATQENIENKIRATSKVLEELNHLSKLLLPYLSYKHWVECIVRQHQSKYYSLDLIENKIKCLQRLHLLKRILNIKYMLHTYTY